MKSPFVHFSHTRARQLERLELGWTIFATIGVFFLFLLFPNPWIGLASPWSLLCTWAVLRLSLTQSLVIALGLSSLWETLSGQDPVVLMIRHLLATALIYCIRLPINASFPWLFTIHLVIWTLCFSAFTVFEPLLYKGPMSSFSMTHILYASTIIAIKDGFFATALVSLPLSLSGSYSTD